MRPDDSGAVLMFFWAWQLAKHFAQLSAKLGCFRDSMTNTNQHTPTGPSGLPSTSPLRLGLWCAILFGCALLLLNFYGEMRSPRSELLYEAPDSHYRFPGDAPIDFDDVLLQLVQLESVDDASYVREANLLVSKALGHIKWESHDPGLYFQRVPMWENFILNLMGRFSGLPFYERYHFVDYKRSLRRGIGICGDASMVLNQLLDARGIENDILVFKGHVVTRVFLGDDEFIADPDFGVLIPLSLEELPSSLAIIRSAYLEKGYSDREAEVMKWTYSTKYTLFDDVYHFITKRVWFEHLAYIFKWIIPLALIIFGVLALKFFNPVKENNKN